MVNIATDRLVLSDYPNLLLESAPKRLRLPRRPLLLLGLVIFCILPRALIIVECTSVCPDATLYIKFARSIENSGDLADNVPLQIVVYPTILAALHSLGFDFESGARIWGVLLSSLTVLPLFGWLRRAFDDRVAVAGCFLYAVHQRFVEWSPSILRDQTFWFLFALALYLLWRAVVEVRPGMFVAAACCIILSTAMRLEGILLLIPFAIWTVCRWLALREYRYRLAAGATLGISVFPCVLFILGATFLYMHTGREDRQLPELIPVQKWQASIGSFFNAFADGHALSSPDGPSSPAGSAAATPLETEYGSRMSCGKMLWEYLRALEGGITAVYGLLMLGGIWHWRRVWARRDNQPLFFVALVILAGIWLDFRSGLQTSQRYPLTIVLMSLPFAAAALLGVSQCLQDVAKRMALSRRWQFAALAAPVILVAAVNFSEVSSRRYKIWESYAKIGQWMRSESAPATYIAGHEAIVKVAGYYSDGDYISIPRIWTPAEIARILSNRNVNYFLVSKRELRDFDVAGMLAELDRWGFKQVDASRLPTGTDCVMVFQREVIPPAQKSP